jgi:hypothetical protein
MPFQQPAFEDLHTDSTQGCTSDAFTSIEPMPYFSTIEHDTETSDALEIRLADNSAASVHTRFESVSEESLQAVSKQTEPVRTIRPAYPTGPNPKPKRFYRTVWRGITKRLWQQNCKMVD